MPDLTHLPAKLAACVSDFSAARHRLDQAEEKLERGREIMLRNEPASDLSSTAKAARSRAEGDVNEVEPLLPGLRAAVLTAADNLYSQVLNSDPEENPWVNTAQLMQRVADADGKFKQAEREWARTNTLLAQELDHANKRIDRLEGTAIDALMDLRDAKADVSALLMQRSVE